MVVFLGVFHGVLSTQRVGNADCHWGNWGFLFKYSQLTGMVPIFVFLN